MNTFHLLAFLLGCIFSINALKFEELSPSKRNILPSKEDCGVQVCDDAFPWVVFIPLQSRVYNPDANIRCAGALINKRYVLTLKTCLQFVLSHVQIGQYDTSTDVTCKGNPVLNIKVNKTVVSDDYESILLRLEEEVEYRDDIKPICLPFEEFKTVNVNDEVHTSGWGLINHNGNENVNIMKNIRATVVDIQECKGQGHAKELVNHAICVQKNEGNKDNLCSGDEGSPIMYNDNGHWVIEGILSYLFHLADKPCTLEKPARGFQITHDILDWIVENIRE